MTRNTSTSHAPDHDERQERHASTAARRRRQRPAPIGWAAACAFALLAAPGCIGGSRFTTYIENDVLNGSDRHYTSGERFTWMWEKTPEPGERAAAAEAAGDAAVAEAETAPGAEPSPAARRESRLSAIVRYFDLGTRAETTQWGFIFGQEFYTPEHIRYPEHGLLGRTPKERAEYRRRNDRPFAGWLYVGGLWATAAPGAEGAWEGDSVGVWELDLGPTGPSSFSDATQISYHHFNFVDSPRPQGWDSQVGTQLGVKVVREWRDRIAAGEGETPSWDLISRYGGAIGNVDTRAAAGLMIRAGTWLPRDFGPNSIHSSSVEVTAAGARTAPAFAVDVFAAADVSAVAYNVFLDGRLNGDDDDIDVRKVPLVGEARLGATVHLGRGFRIVLAQVLRSKEFLRQDGHQSYVSLSLAFGTAF